jgi:hypothetical protein
MILKFLGNYTVTAVTGSVDVFLYSKQYECD